MSCIHQCKVCILYKHGPDFHITDRLSLRNHAEDKDQEITSLNINVNAISKAVIVPVCTSIEDIQAATHRYAPLQKLKSYIIYVLPHHEELEHSIRHYWLIRSELAMIDAIAVKGKRIIIPFLLQKQILQQLHRYHMGIYKMRL